MSPEQSRIYQLEQATRNIHQSLFRLGEIDTFDSAAELPRIAHWLEAQVIDLPEAVFSAFRFMVTEQPHKTPLTAALVGVLTLAPGSFRAEDPQPTLGMRVANDLAAALVDDVARHHWRNVRLYLAFFAALVPLGIVSAADVRNALKALVPLLEGPPGEHVAMCIIHTLCRAGADLLQAGGSGSPKEELDELVAAVSTFASGLEQPRLLSPFRLDDLPEDLGFLHTESFADYAAALTELQSKGYRRPAFLPAATDLIPVSVSPVASDVPQEQRSLALLLGEIPRSPEARPLPPPLPTTRPDTGKGIGELVRASFGPPHVACSARWFGSSVPEPGSPAAVVLRTIINDIIDLYVANRKECSVTLLALPMWFRRGTFGGHVELSRGIFGEEDASWAEAEGQWSLEDILVETVLAAALELPNSPHNELYYTSLLREIVSAAPQQVAPSLGRTMRRFHAASGSARIDGEVLRRVADWFSIHLSNFNFTWAWHEWVGDAERPWPQAQRAFIRRLVELEVRLAYYDRIRDTLPDELLDVLMPADEPTPEFTYARADHPYHAQAMQLHNSVKAKASVQVVEADLHSFEQSILAPDALPTDDTASRGLVSSPEDAALVVRDVAMQALLNAGSRSFSHLLNVMERYNDLLRQLSSTPSARIALLESTACFWAKSPQWVLIVVDKLLQYRIVEPADVVEYVFAPQESSSTVPFEFAADARAYGGTLRDWSSFNWWVLIRLTVEKVVGRVEQLTRRLDTLVREEEAMHATVPPPREESETHALPPRPAAPAPFASVTSEEAKIHLDAIVLEQRKVLVRTMTGFVELLGQSNVWHEPPEEDSGAEAWQAWWISQWYTEFVRLFRGVLSANKEIIMANVFATTRAEDRALVIFEEACALPK
ncbi:Nuclear cap-binding protein subunit 1 [Malassezia cuniculi]|uniref:Nuclear cap-binding protein subunit 1 n=1 Tax=Malassezia cuniculi TaxID=948313 RepID=A0AAF0J6P5_9BASI|nr:Nuclear cap-binding protein subunit 1 [Malassezia cuniculi]